MEGFGLLASPTKRELSEKELEAESALLMLLSRSDDASRPVENGMQRINHYGARFSAFGAASGREPNATSPSAPSLEEEVRGRYRTADVTATSTFSSPPQPTAEHQAPRTRVSIYSLLNDDDEDEVRPATRGGNDTSFLFASTPASSSSSRSTPTSPVLSRPPESLVSAGRAARSPPMPRTSSDVEVRSSGRSRSKSAGGRKLLSSSSPSVAQKPAGGRKRKATNKSATAAAGTGATTTPSTAGLKYDRRTKKQRQLELLQSVNSGRSVVLSDSLGAEDIAATLASSPLLAFSSSFLPSMLATRTRERTAAPTAAEDEEQPHHPPSMEVVNGDDVTRAGGSMLPPAPLASYLSAISSPLPAGAGSPLPLPSSLAQLQQLLPSPLPAGIDQQRVQQLKSQLMPQQQAPSSPTGSSTNTTSGGGGSVSSPGANVQSMTNYLNLNLNINSHHTSRFGDKKRERRDSFSFTYPTRNGDHHQHQQHHQTVHGPAAAPPSAPLPQHQQEFLQQLLQQIHKKQTVGTPTLPDASPREAVVAASSADSSVAVDAGPTSPSLVRFYQRPPHTILPSLGGALPLPAEADVTVAETSDVPHTEVVRSEEDAPLQPMDEQQPPEAEQTHAETDGDEVAVEVEVEIESEPMDVAVQVETVLESESESGNNSDNQDTTTSSVSNSQESASGAESSTNEMQTEDFECVQRPPPAEVLECGPQEGRTASIESHHPADGNNSGGGISILVEGEGGLDDPSSSFQGAMSADDVFAGRRKKASPQQMAILEQIWSTTGFRGAFRASTALDFTSSFPSLSSVSASSRNRSSSGSAGASPQLSSSSSSSSSSSPAAVADALLSSSRPSPVLLASSSPTLSFAISSPNLPTFLASSSLGHPTRSEPDFHAAGRREDRDDDDEREDAGGLTIEDDDDDEEEEPNEREVEALVIASVPCTTLPHLQRSSAILLPSSSSSSSTYSPASSLSSSLSSTYDRATMERSQPGGSAESASSSSSSSSSSPPAVSGEGDDQSRPAPTTAGSDADRCLGSGLGFGAHGSCENGSVGA